MHSPDTTHMSDFDICPHHIMAYASLCPGGNVCLTLAIRHRMLMGPIRGRKLIVTRAALFRCHAALQHLLSLCMTSCPERSHAIPHPSPKPTRSRRRTNALQVTRSSSTKQRHRVVTRRADHIPAMGMHVMVESGLACEQIPATDRALRGLKATLQHML